MGQTLANNIGAPHRTALCEREGLTIAGLYEDRAISGASTMNRMGWQRLMRDARSRKFSVVVAEALDRISRDQEDLAGIHKRLSFAGIKIITVQDGVAGEIHIGVKGLLGALYLKDLPQKTHRGQAGVVRDGRYNGGRSYGYRPVLGRPGVLEIDEAEAAVVRRICRDYLDGRSPRDIAVALNKERLSGPRGGAWNASTIAGSRTRRNGILQNELYGGRVVWNRQRFIKDPETGKRVSRPNSPDQWMSAEAEQLRIVDAKTWQLVQERIGTRAGTPHKARAAHLLSGLLKCGCCGSGYVGHGSDKRGTLLACSRMKETGLCDNKKRVARERIEERVLAALEEHLGDPELVAEYVREYHRTVREVNSQAASLLRTIDKKLGNINGQIRRLVDAIANGTVAPRAVADRLAELEAEREEVERERTAIGVDPVEFHPNAANAYRDKIRSLKRTLAAAGDESRQAAFQGLREIIEKIVIHPGGRYEAVDLEIFGQLAAILKISEAAGGASESKRALVAGARFELATFRL
jgi:site-specific DNA recombinase